MQFTGKECYMLQWILANQASSNKSSICLKMMNKYWTFGWKQIAWASGYGICHAIIVTFIN